MGITKRELDRAEQEHGQTFKGTKDEYFALLHLAREFEKGVDQVARHVAFGEDAPEGINAFHIDVNRRNLYLFRFDWSEQYQRFKEPLRRLVRCSPRRG